MQRIAAHAIGKLSSHARFRRDSTGSRAPFAPSETARSQGKSSGWGCVLYIAIFTPFAPFTPGKREEGAKGVKGGVFKGVVEIRREPG